MSYRDRPSVRGRRLRLESLEDRRLLSINSLSGLGDADGLPASLTEDSPAAAVYASQSESVAEVLQFTDYSGAYSVSYPVTSDGVVAWVLDPAGSFPQVLMYEAQTGATTQITDYPSGSGAMSQPAIGDGVITWAADPPGPTTANIFAYDVDSETLAQITTHSSGSSGTTHPVTSGGVVAWVWNPFNAFPQVVMYETQTETTTQITSYGSGFGGVYQPDISDDVITWAADPPGPTGPNQFVYDVQSETLTQITNYSGNYDLSFPVTSDGVVAWVLHPVGSVPQVFMYDVQTDTIAQITNYGSGIGSVFQPDIGDGIITWTASGPGLTAPNQFVYDVPGETLTQITSYIGGHGVSWPVTSDGVVTWALYAAGEFAQLFLYDTQTGETHPVTSESGFDFEAMYLPDTAGGLITWTGDLFGPTGPNQFVTALPRVPLVDLNGPNNPGVDFSATFTEDGGPVAIVAPDAKISGAYGAALTSLGVTIANLPDGAHEILTADTAGTGISADYDNGELTLSGEDTPENYQQVLRSVRYENTSQNPDTTPRSIVFVAGDGTNDSDPATTTVLIQAVNDPPEVETNLGLTVDEGAAGAIGNDRLLATDEDNAESELVFKVRSAPSHGTLWNGATTVGLGATFTQVDVAAGRIRYQHDGSETTSDSFAFSVSDGAGGTTPRTTFSITVIPQNDIPRLEANLGLIVNEGASGPIGNDRLLASDDDNSPWELVFTVLSTPAHGTLWKGLMTLGPGNTFAQGDIDAGRIRYQHDGSETTADGFAFTVSDGAGGMIPQTTFDFTVIPVNDPPENTVPDSQSIAEDTLLTFSAALENRIEISDPDAGGNPVEVTLTAAQGVLSVGGTAGLSFSVGDGTQDATMIFTGTITDVNAALEGMTFMPTAHFNGAAGLEITTDDRGYTGSGGAHSDTDAIDIAVFEVNDPPMPVDDSFQAVENTPLMLTSFDLTFNDSPGPPIESGQTLSVTAVSPTSSQGGTVVLGGDNTITYIRPHDFRGYDSFSYTVTDNGTTDGRADPRSAVGTVTVHVIDPRGPAATREGQITKVPADDGRAYDWFGISVSTSGNTAVVGAFGDDDNGSGSGSAYVLERDYGGTDQWWKAAKLLAADGGPSQWFGYSVSISGNTAIVGSYGDDDRGAESGSAYIFEDSGSGWTEGRKLLPEDGQAGDRFGISVSISGSIAIVGAPENDDNGANSGSAYIFRDTGATWTQVAKLLPDDGFGGARFGHAVSISGNTAVVGAHGGNLAYVFRDTGAAWTQIARLSPADVTAGDQFGYSVSISGSTAVVGANGDDDQGIDSGSAYIFEDTGSAWTQAAKLLPREAAAGGGIGYSVSISGNTAVVGANRDGDNGVNSGSAYVFRDSGSAWTQADKLLPDDGAAQDEFGLAVSISGKTIFIGAAFDNHTGSDSGSVYIFRGSAWEVSDDTGAHPADKLTNDDTPELTLTLYEAVYGQDDDVEALDPDLNPVAPDSISGWGTDKLTIAFTTPLAVEGQYTVILHSTIADAAGNPLNDGADEVRHFTLDTAAPTPTVDPLVTADATPSVDGTVDDSGAEVEVTINGFQYTALNRGDGTWTLPDDTINPPLGRGSYDVQVTATDAAGNTGADGTSDELVVYRTLYWDGQGDGNWNDPAGGGFYRWDDTAGDPSSTYPDGRFTDAVVRSDVVTVTADRSVGQLSIHSGTLAVDNGVTVDPAAGFAVSNAATLAVQMGGETTGLVDVAANANLDGTLELEAVANLGDLSAGEWGAKARTIIEADGAINGTFDVEPAAYAPADYQNSHLGYGVFHHDVDYNADTVTANLFQAGPGDADGDGFFNFADLVAIFSESGAYYGDTEVTDRGWTGGDFTGDGSFTFADLVAAFSSLGAHYGGDAYAELPAANEVMAAAHDVVLAGDVEQEPPARSSSLSDLAWITEYERSAARRPPASSIAPAVDELLATWP